jgi:hypothetical protein
MGSITVDISEGIATIQLNRPATLNALLPEGELASTKLLLTNYS